MKKTTNKPITAIQLMRVDGDLYITSDGVTSGAYTELTATEDNYGQPCFVHNSDDTSDTGSLIIPWWKDANTNGKSVFQGVDISRVGTQVFRNTNGYAETVDSSDTVSSKYLYAKNIQGETNGKYYLAGVQASGTNSEVGIYASNTGVYIDGGTGVINGAAWNDYAEFRECTNQEPGYVVCEQGDGTLGLSEKRLQPLPYVVSDTYGMVIGGASETKAPVTVAGRVLVYVEGIPQLGDVICAGEDGKAAIMTREEVINYPDRILGIVAEIPTYTKWNDIEVNGRVWIKLK